MLSTLGIRELNNTMQQVSEPGVYWINVPDADTALFMAARAAGVAQGCEAEDFIIVQPELLPDLSARAVTFAKDSSFQVLTCPHDKHHEHRYFATISRLLRHSKTQRRSIIVLSKAEHVANNSESVIHKVVSKLQVYCMLRNTRILVLNYGQQAALCTKLLRSTRDHFRGMAELQHEGGTFGYLIAFWRGENQYFQDRTFVLEPDAQGLLKAQADKNSSEQMFVDDELFCSNSPLLTSALAASNVFTPAADLKGVYDYGLQHAGSYLVFELEDLAELPDLARYIYTLRRQNGAHLKLAVTVSPKVRLRTHSQLLLMRSGANIVFENGVSFGYISAVLSSLRHAVYTEALPYSFTVIERAFTIMQYIGLMDIGNFLNLLELELQDLGLSDLSSGCLLRLKFKRQVKARHGARQFAPRRPGDIAAAFEDEMLIFMLGLTPDMAERTLYKTFNLKPDLLFDEVQYFFTYEDLSTQMQELQLKAREDAGVIEPVDMAKVQERTRTADENREQAVEGETCRLLGVPHIVEL